MDTNALDRPATNPTALSRGSRASRRSLLAGLGALVAAPGAAGCGSGRPSRVGPAGRGKPLVQVHFISRGDEATHQLFRQQARALAEEAPEVRIEIDHATDWLEKFKALVSSGAAVDALFHAHAEVGTSAREGLLENLEPYLARQPDFREGDFEKGAWRATQYDGKRRGLPWSGGAYALAFNVDLFHGANVPLPDPKKRMTWDDLLGIARRLTVDATGRHPTERGFDPGTVKVHGFSTNTSWGLATFIMSSGGELLTADGKVPVDGPDAVEALQFVADLRTKHHIWPEPGAITAAPVAFEHGNLAMTYDGVWQVGRYNAAGLRWGVAPAPMRKVAVSGAHYSPLVMARAAGQKDATWDWLQFACLSERGQRLLVDAGRMQPTRKSLEARFVEAETPPALPSRQVFADELKGGTLRATGDRTGTYWGGHQRDWGRLWAALLHPLLRQERTAMQVGGDLRRHTELLLKLGRLPVDVP